MRSNQKDIPGNRVELLSPAGGMDCLKAAVNNGCDAVYIGGKDFSARMHAENFDTAGLEAAIDYAHLRGVKVYVAVNTLYKDFELSALARFCAMAYRAGADAFIVQDIGLAEFIHKKFDISLHASTQLTVRSAADAEFLKKFGFSRFILSRETPLDEIKRITALGVEVEVFIHGALCCSHSGQCLMSSFIGGRSGNRGDCAQPCRRRYGLAGSGKEISEGYLLSPKDMQTLDILPEIIDAGVISLKIEGRMKSPRYVALVTRAYRGRIDGFIPTDATKSELAQVFSRGGEFCEGYFKTHSSPGMISTIQKSSGVLIGEVVKYIPQNGKCVISLSGGLVCGDGIYIGECVGTYYNSATPAKAGDVVTVNVSGKISPGTVLIRGDKVYKSYDKTLDDRLKTLAAAETRKLLLTSYVEAKLGQPLQFSLECTGIIVTAYGRIIENAVKNPITRERLLLQLSKVGNTPFAIRFAGCDIDDNIYADIKEINDLRRNAVAEMGRRINESYKRSDIDINIKIDDADFNDIHAIPVHNRYTVLVNTIEQALVALEYAPYRIYIESTPDNLNNLGHITVPADRHVKIFAALPQCMPPDEAGLLAQLEASGIDGYLVRTYRHLQKLENLESTKEIALDYSFNVMNTHSFKSLSGYASSICISPEICRDGITSVTGAIAEAVIYGRLTLMTTNLCPVGVSTEKGSGKYCRMRGSANKFMLTCHNDVQFPVIRDCESCTARILSPIRENMQAGAEPYRRLDFTTEAPEVCNKVLSTLCRTFRNFMLC